MSLNVPFWALGNNRPRRGWLEKKDIFNTQSAAQVARALEEKRS
jgi:hypothetical protein